MGRQVPGEFLALLRRRGAVAAATLALLVLASCTPRQPYPLPERPDIPHGQGRLWKVEREGLAPSYVFGTMHVDDKRVMDLPPAVETAFAAADTAAFELIDDTVVAVETLYDERMELTGDETLEELIGSRSFGILRWHMKQRMLVPKNNIKPWVFWEYMGGEAFGFVDYGRLEPSGHGMVLDDWLEDRAAKSGKKVVGLETIEEQIDIYDKIPLDQQADLLKLALDRYSDHAPWVPKVELYLNGDLAMFEALWREYLSWLPPDTAETIDLRLIDDRNRIMVERMAPLMAEASTFVAVGAAHLAGEEGVLFLLEQEGYRVTRLH
ncbi:TraB/GumN family protein [Pelagibius sp. CAU 1746]|uniref:TraB/GumN family protein n=1 Tax=Pelagibius sp. CAU 1746 TaxID=3140370 RepID=UPI00325AE530